MTSPSTESLPSNDSEVCDVVQSVRERTCDALNQGAECVRRNPIPVILGAVVVGAALGALICRKDRQENDALLSARHWLEDFREQVASKLPAQRKSFLGFARSEPTLADHAQELGKKLKWW